MKIPTIAAEAAKIGKVVARITAPESFRIKGLLEEDDVSPLERKARSTASYEWAEPHKDRCIRERFVLYADKHHIDETTFTTAAKMVGVSSTVFIDAAYTRLPHNGELHWISLIPGWVFASSKLDTYLVRQDRPRTASEIVEDIRLQIKRLQDEYKKMPSTGDGYRNHEKTKLYHYIETEMAAYDSL